MCLEIDVMERKCKNLEFRGEVNKARTRERQASEL
jgi:hypothetical protein